MNSSRFKPFIGLIKEAKPVWICLGGVVLAGLLARVPQRDAVTQVRFASTWLQIFGVCSAVWSLWGVRKSFGLSSFPAIVASWLRRLRALVIRPQTIHGTAHIHGAGAVALAGSIRLEVKAGPNSSLERRVEILEANLSRLRTEVDETQRDLRAQIQRVQTALDEHRVELLSEAARLKQEVQGLAVRGLPLQWIGIVWVALGTLGSSIPDEIVWLLRALGVSP